MKAQTPRFCGKCGKPIAGNSVFCVYCGEKLSVDVAAVDSTNTQNATPNVGATKGNQKRNPFRKIVLLLVAIIAISVGVFVCLRYLGPKIKNNQTQADAGETTVVSVNPSTNETSSTPMAISESENGSADIVDESATATGRVFSPDLPAEIVSLLQEAYDNIDNQLFSEAFSFLKSIDNGDQYDDVTEAKNYLQYAWGCYSLENGEYRSASSRFLKLDDYPGAEDKYLEAQYLYAKSLQESGDMLEAYKEFIEIPDYSDVPDITAYLLEELYQTAVSDYHTGMKYEQQSFDELKSAKTEQEIFFIKLSMPHGGSGADYFDAARDIFKVIDGYKDSSDYNLLFVARGVPTAAEYSDFLNLIPFENSAMIAITSESTCSRFLKGSWKNSTGSNYMTFTEIDTVDVNLYISATNIPNTLNETTQFYAGLYSSNDYQFLISAIDKDTINVYSYTNGTTYTLYRQ